MGLLGDDRVEGGGVAVRGGAAGVAAVAGAQRPARMATAFTLAACSSRLLSRERMMRIISAVPGAQRLAFGVRGLTGGRMDVGAGIDVGAEPG